MCKAFAQFCSALSERLPHEKESFGGVLGECQEPASIKNVVSADCGDAKTPSNRSAL